MYGYPFRGGFIRYQHPSIKHILDTEGWVKDKQHFDLTDPKEDEYNLSCWLWWAETLKGNS